MLDNRLKTCAELVSGNGIVCDVGTDHAYLAAELIKTGKCSRVIASDINEGPLESARRTVESFGISDKVELVLSDGLKNICLNGVSDIVIAGMGGETIIDIIKERLYELSDIKLILQPMTKAEVLRKWLSNNKFEIIERAVEASGKVYSVIECYDCGVSCDITEFESINGAFTDVEKNKKLISNYREAKAERYEKAAISLRKAGRINETIHYSSLAQKLLYGVKAVSKYEIYDFLNEKYPFSLQEKWDNSGFLIENSEEKCKKILLTLDISNSAVREASDKFIDLVISHHPVIFEPLKKINSTSPVMGLIEYSINAICMHTNLDIAEGGTNSVIVKKISEKLRIKNISIFDDSDRLGHIIELDESITASAFGEILKDIFKCEYVKMNRSGNKFISKIAICSGSGGSMLGLAIEKNCDAYITGDIKHDVWITANNIGITLFDCGHFHTENLVLWELRRVLEEKFPLIDIEIAEASVDPCVYI